MTPVKPLPLRERLIAAKAHIKEVTHQLAQLEKRKAFLVAACAELEKQLGKETTPEAAPAPKIEYSEEFERFWSIYPDRNGRKPGKDSAYSRFKSIKKTEYDALRTAILNYNRSDEVKRGYARDMQRFLKSDFWPTWIDETEQRRANKKPEPNNASEVVNEAIKKAIKRSPEKAGV